MTMKQKLIHYQVENTSARPEIDRRYYHNYHFEPHFHDKSELIFVSEGKLLVTVDGNRQSVSANQFCLILPWQVHSFLTETESRSLILVFPNELIDRFLKDMESFRFESQVFKAEGAILDLFLRHLSDGPLPDDYIISGILYSLCHCFITSAHPFPARIKDRASALPEMLVYIVTHANENLTLRSVADQLGYSYHHLSHLFNEYVGMSFPQFVNAHRIFNCLRVLRNSSDSISDIAFEFGFSNIRSFNRNFRELIGMTPGEYRRNPPKSDFSDEIPSGSGVYFRKTVWENI